MPMICTSRLKSWNGFTIIRRTVPILNLNDTASDYCLIKTIGDCCFRYKSKTTPNGTQKYSKEDWKRPASDHIIISDPNTGMRYLLLMVNLDYITFDEELQYSTAFGGLPTRR